MYVNIHFPLDLEQRLRAETPDLDAQATEAVAVALFRQGKLSH